MCNIDKQFHEIYEYFDRIRWESFPSFGIEDYYHGWYYAGEQLFIIRDAMMDSFIFVRAENIKEAYEKYTDRWLHVMNAGALMDEGEDEI